MRPMETIETQKDYRRLMRPMCTQETQRDQWGFIRLRETNGDS